MDQQQTEDQQVFSFAELFDGFSEVYLDTTITQESREDVIVYFMQYVDTATIDTFEDLQAVASYARLLISVFNGAPDESLPAIDTLLNRIEIFAESSRFNAQQHYRGRVPLLN